MRIIGRKNFDATVILGTSEKTIAVRLCTPVIQVDTVDVQVIIFDEIETCIDAACFLAEYLFSPYTIQFSLFPLSFIQTPLLFEVTCRATIVASDNDFCTCVLLIVLYLTECLVGR